MRLKNKQTGEICDFKIIADYDDCTSGWRLEKHNGEVLFYDHIDEIHSEWEDAPEEPKGMQWVDVLGANDGRVVIQYSNEGEAEKAVEKLKAWKRLKDKGFRFTAWYGGSKNISYEITSLENETYIPRQICDDLDLLLGGEG